MTRRKKFSRQSTTIKGNGRDLKSRGSLDADIIIANAPDPVFVSDLEGKIVQANDAVSQLLGFRQDEVLEQSLSRFITPDETREFTAALREVVERGVMRNVVLNPRSASGEVIPIACAVWSSFDHPRSAASWANTVLSETVVACATLIVPW